jgi:rhodanese-related sulfurtransferase
MGYSDLSILKGGFRGWQQSGLATVKGDYVLAHSLGLYVDRMLETPSISANSLMQKLAAQEDILIIDSRDPVDFRYSTLPGSINIPIAELVYRVPDLIESKSSQIVVHCGGVTRGVLGAQTLIDAKLPNQVMWLQEGTTGWGIAGGDLCRGKTEPENPPSDGATNYATNTAQYLATQYNLAYLEPDELEGWRLKNQNRTCYVIDVRSREDYLANHHPDAIHIPGGELVGMTQDHIATYNARLCLLGDTYSARAEITASWMLRNGWGDVVILKNWEHETENNVSANPCDITEPDNGSSTSVAGPENTPISILQTSVDTRQQIFKSFLHDQPYRFNLNVADTSNDRSD